MRASTPVGCLNARYVLDAWKVSEYKKEVALRPVLEYSLSTPELARLAQW